MGTQLLDHRGNLLIAQHEDRNHSSTHDRIVVASEMECEQLIRENRALRDNQTGKEEFRLVARFPAPMVEKAMLEGWLDDDKKWGELINDPQYRDFRVAEGTY
jgi:hypothetical protein